MSNRRGTPLNRRTMLGAVAAGAGLVALNPAGALAAPPDHAGRPGGPKPRETLLPAQTSWDPEPEFRGTQGFVELPDVRLWCWDSGGTGQAIIFLHAHVGSGATWNYQHDALSKAGYRVISYSRRGYDMSERGPEDDPGTMADDLDALATALGIDRFHVVGTAGGGFAVFDYALSFPERLLSATVASTLAGIQEPEFQDVTRAILPPGWFELPEDFRELGPSYRAANREGTAAWLDRVEHAYDNYMPQGSKNAITWDAISRVRTPVMLLTGTCDLYLPPARLRQIASHVRQSETVVISEAGHTPFWEQYLAYNKAVLSFVRKHRR
ncbi:alpha/beta fold hydrolase [Phytoactinopolyspora limicola]|uniref:alpha/beta fold hydrolase n=1 Tax=Phytoactinopolyspora limicola TaxID=2715536 RepID=UPI00140B15C7|nr:alpha/beta hydrolase [Phytoactinopolyspora limicola]